MSSLKNRLWRSLLKLKELAKLAGWSQVYSAARNYRETAFEVVALSNQEILCTTLLPRWNILPAACSSSRWRAVHWARCLAGGAWWDLGVYCLTWPSASLEPNLQSPHRQQLSHAGWSLWSGVWSIASGCYSGGENITSHLSAEIYTKTGTLTLNAVAAINQAQFVSHAGEAAPSLTPCSHVMQEEAGSLVMP